MITTAGTTTAAMTTSAMTTSATTMTPGPAVTRWDRTARLIGWELRLLARRRTTLLSLLIGPVSLIGFGLLLNPPDPAGWAVLAGLAAVVGLLTATYTTAATVLTMRRESLVLARMRTSELPSTHILGIPLVALAGIGVVQAVVVSVAYAALGASAPQQPLLILLGVVVGAVLASVAAVGTSTLSSTAEGVQYAVMPLLLLSAVGANLLAQPLPDEIRIAVLLIPLTPLADLVARAWVGTVPGMVTMPFDLPPVLVDLGLLVAWSAVLVALSRRRWRWTPRE